MSCCQPTNSSGGVVYTGCAGDKPCCACPPGDKGDQGVKGDPGPRGQEGPTVVSANAGNIVTLGSDGFIFLDSVAVCGAGFINSVVDTSTIDLTKTGCSLTAAVKSSADPGNQVQLRPDGVYVPTPALPTREYIEDILANTFPQFVYDDPGNSYTIASVPTTAFTGWQNGCGIIGLATPTSPLSIDRTALVGVTAQTSLEPGSGTCDLQVKIDGNTIKRLASGALVVDYSVIPCTQFRGCISGSGVITYSAVTGVIGTTLGPNGSVLTQNGAVASWQMPIVPVSGAGTTVTVGSGVVDVDVDTLKGLDIVADKIVVKPGCGINFDATGGVQIKIDPASCCVSCGPNGLLIKKEPTPVPVLMCAGGVPFSVVISQDCDGNVTGITYVNMVSGLTSLIAPAGLGSCEAPPATVQTVVFGSRAPELRPPSPVRTTYSVNVTNPSTTGNASGHVTFKSVLDMSGGTFGSTFQAEFLFDITNNGAPAHNETPVQSIIGNNGKSQLRYFDHATFTFTPGEVKTITLTYIDPSVDIGGFVLDGSDFSIQGIVVVNNDNG